MVETKKYKIPIEISDEEFKLIRHVANLKKQSIDEYIHSAIIEIAEEDNAIALSDLQYEKANLTKTYTLEEIESELNSDGK